MDLKRGIVWRTAEVDDGVGVKLEDEARSKSATCIR